MTERKDASWRLCASRLPQRGRDLEGTWKGHRHIMANTDCFCPQEPEKAEDRSCATGVHARVLGAAASSSAAEESSDSDAEQEGPQKLIRKVSTSGQIRTKVGQMFCWCAPSLLTAHC